jgi:hypothetical protein
VSYNPTNDMPQAHTSTEASDYWSFVIHFIKGRSTIQRSDVSVSLFVESIIVPQLIIHPMIPSNYITGTEAIASVARDEITLDQVLQDHKDRYVQRNNQVKAWVCVDHTGTNDKVLEGPLRGMIIGIKDIISTS